MNEKNYLRLKETLTRKSCRSREAVKLVTEAVWRARAGIKDPNRQSVHSYFLGPTGVGKTELAKALSCSII